VKKKTTEQFIEEALKVHDGKYDYSLVDYKASNIKVEIVCKACEIHFQQSPNSHLKGIGCPVCGYKKSSKSLSFAKEVWLERFEKMHGDKYDYSNSVISTNRNPIEIKCKKCGYIFKQSLQSHALGAGCRLCGYEESKKKQRKPLEQFIKEAIEVHGNRYDYSSVIYTNKNAKILLKCKTCGSIFLQTACEHLQGHGCRTCSKQSSGELLVANCLKKNNVEFIEQYAAPGCIYLNQLYFDFFLPDYNIAIEFNGIQHYQVVDYFGGEKEFLEQQKRDQAKKDYCLKENIFLIEIKYDQNIEEALKDLAWKNSNAVRSV
jgi:rubrerythrin